MSPFKTRNLRTLGRRGRPIGSLVAIVALGAVLSSCGNSARSLAQQACTHVQASVNDLDRAGRATDPSEATHLRQQAYAELLDAIPIAAQAARVDGQWQSLLFTVSEVNRVPEANLVPALRAECAATRRTVFDQLPPPTSPAPSTSLPTTSSPTGNG